MAAVRTGKKALIRQWSQPGGLSEGNIRLLVQLEEKIRSRMLLFRVGNVTFWDHPPTSIASNSFSY